MAVASPDVAEKFGATTRDSCVVELPFIHEDDDRYWAEWLAANGIEAPQHLPGPRCWHAHLAIDAARRGRGIALASRFLVDSDLKRGDLVQFKMAGTKPVVLGSYVLVAREDRWSVPALVALRGMLREATKPFIEALA